jgi:hypothetical protein
VGAGCPEKAAAPVFSKGAGLSARAFHHRPLDAVSIHLHSASHNLPSVHPLFI